MPLTSETVSWIDSIDAETGALQDIACLVDLDDPALQGAARLPPNAEDRLRGAAYGDAVRARFFSRRAALRHLVAARLGCPAETVVIGVGESGAPRLAAPDSRSAHFLSISGRAAFAAFAVASRPIGIDIEILGEPEPVPQEALHPNETARLAALGESERHKAFLEIWTVKEAYFKALRVGLAREPGEVEIFFGTDGRVCIIEGGAPVAARVSVREIRKRAATTILAACVLL